MKTVTNFSHLLNENSSKEIAETHDYSTYIVTCEIKRHFENKNMRTVKKELFEKHGKYGTYKTYNSSLKPTQSTYCLNKCMRQFNVRTSNHETGRIRPHI